MLKIASQKLKAKNESDEVADEEDYNKNISMSLSTDQTNREENANNKTLKFLKSKYLAKSKKLSKSENIDIDDDGNKDLEQNILQQRDFTRFLTSPMPIIKPGEHFPVGRNTCSISVEEDTHLQITSIDGFFNRKRGRPPKNRYVALYKNTHPIPQAIFTSFKLEKLETKDTETSEKEANIYFYTDLHTLRDCGGNDGNKTSDYSRQKPPTSKNSTQRKRTYDTLNNYSSPPSSITSSETVQTTIGQACGEIKAKCDHDTNKHVITHNTEKIIPKTNCKTWTKPTASTAQKVHTCVTEESITKNTSSSCYNHKFFETTENLTVVRAAGTFYPENSNDNSKFTDFVLTKLQEGPNHKRVPEPLEVKYRANLKGNAIPQDLRKRERETSSEKSSSTPNSNFDLPQIFITLQMQQQFLAFWQQMVLMAPIFSCMDLKNIANVKDSIPFTDSNEHDLEQKQNFLNMLRNKTNQGQNINTNVKYPTRDSETTTTEAIGHLRPSQYSTATSAKHLQKITSPLEHEDMFYKNGDLPRKGYIRWRSKDDCGFDKCGYRHQSHFHCNRLNCQYSFCDKTRFVQHSTRHERLDNLMGYEFQQYSAKMSCNISNCPYFSEIELSSQKSSTHFHCLKCQFVSVDSNKIVAHRRLHSKMEFIRSAGFRKVTSNENCSNISNLESESPSSENLIIATTFISSPTINSIHHRCPYSMRQAHYHCLTCNGSVLSRSHLISHKHRSHRISTSAIVDDATIQTPTEPVLN